MTIVFYRCLQKLFELYFTLRIEQYLIFVHPQFQMIQLWIQMICYRLEGIDLLDE
jgi:hypothetical protein